MLPVAGVVSAPVLLKSSACGVPTAAPSTYRRDVHWLAVAPWVRYSVAVCAAPSESYTVIDVARL
jgi:hypothetical protein